MSERSRVGRVVGVILLALAVLTGCDAKSALSPPGPANREVDVATPELVAMKKAQGVEDCPKPQTTDGGLPAVTLRCFGGGRDVDLSTLKGPLILNMWQSYCGPCRKEMPALQAFHTEYGAQVQVIGLDLTDYQPVGAMQLVKQTGVTYPLIADPAGDIGGTDIWFTRGLPYFVFLRADGTFSIKVGGVDSVEELVELSEHYLGVEL